MIKRLISFFALAAAAIPLSVQAREFVEVRSRALDDGWFEYRLQVVADSLFAEVVFGSIAITNFPGRTEYGVTPGRWTADEAQPEGGGPGFARWTFEEGETQVRPYEATFLVRSSEPAFRTDTLAGVLGFVATPQASLLSDDLTQTSSFLNIPVLVPCPAEEVDGSTASLTVLQDLPLENPRIEGLVVDESGVQGLTFSWSIDSTVRVEASGDLKSWIPVAHVLGDPGETSWSAPVSLNSFGNFYRLVLVASEKKPEMEGMIAGVDP